MKTTHKKGGDTTKQTKDEKIISALLSCPTVRAASAACGLSESQLYARLRDPPFKEKYAAARRELLEHNTAALQGNISAAIDTMAQVCTDTKTPAQTRLNAADSIIRNVLKLTELADVNDRLAKLEEAERERRDN